MALKIKRDKSAKAIGNMFGVNDETVRRWVSGGCPHRRERKGGKLFFNHGEVKVWLESEGKSGRPGRPPKLKDESPNDLGGDRDYWLARKYRNQCLEDEKRLVDKEEYRRHWMTEFITIKNKFIGMGAAIAPQLFGQEAGEIQTAIDARIIQIFNELSEE